MGWEKSFVFWGEGFFSRVLFDALQIYGGLLVMKGVLFKRKLENEGMPKKLCSP